MPGLPQMGDMASGLTSMLSSFASAFTQATHILRMNFAAGSGIPANLLLPHRLTGKETINGVFHFQLDALSSDADIELKEFMGVPVEITILTDAGTERPICGIVIAASQIGSDGGFATYRLIVESALDALKHRRTCRVYTATNVRNLTKKILQEHIDGNSVIGASFSIDDRCTAEYVERPFWMQFNESDLDFLKRLWAREGISFFLQPAEGSTEDHPQHALVLFDEPMELDANTCGSARFHRADGTEQKDSITEWKARRFLQSGSVSRAAWNHESAAMMTASEATQTRQGESGDALASTLEYYRHHMPLEEGEAGVLDSRTLIRMKTLEGQSKQFEGAGTMRTFQVGSWFTLIEHPVHDQDPEQDRDFMITSLDITAVNNLPKDLETGLSGLLSAGSPQDSDAPSSFGKLLRQVAKDRSPKIEPPCTNRFTCVRRGIPILADEIAPPRPGLLSARVVGPEGEEVHVDELGRIKVRFLFTRAEEHVEAGAGDTDADSAWVRLSQMWSSQGFGSSFIPRVNDEVLIQFLGHDPDKPQVAGCISNGVKVPTAFSEVSGLPGDKTLSGIRSKMFHGQGGNELVFDDTSRELRTRLACDHLASQLNLGYLVQPRCGGASIPLGEGFELKTEAWGALRAAKGLLLTTDGGMSDHLENNPLTSQLEASIELSKTLSDASENHKADKLAAIKASEDIKKVLEATKRQGTGAKARNVAAFSEPVLALSSPTGIVAATTANHSLSAGQSIHASSGKDTNLTVGGKLAMAIKEVWSVFTSNAGMKIFAGKSDIALRAHDGELNVTADQAMKVLALNGSLEMLAKNGITLATPGAKFQIKDNEINIEGENCNVYTAMVNLTAPQKADAAMPNLPKGGVKDVGIHRHSKYSE